MEEMGIFEKKVFQKLVVRDSLHLDPQKFITVFMCIYTFYDDFYYNDRIIDK
jgi:hypothetical protein